MNDLEKRVALLEKLVGIDLDSTSACSGEPANCSAEPCNESRCPMKNNLVHRAYQLSLKLEHDVDFIQSYVELMLTPELDARKLQVFRDIAAKKADQMAIYRRAKQAEDIMQKLDKDSDLYDMYSIAQSHNHARMEQLRNEIEALRKTA
jgi:hypothetical protein